MAQSRPSEDVAREWAEYFVRTAGYTTKLHLPAATATPGDPQPLCGRKVRRAGAEWISKPVEVYPPGFSPICKHCRDELDKRLELLVDSV